MVAISRLHISDVSESKAGGRSGLCEGTKLMRAAAEEAKLLLKNEEKLTDNSCAQARYRDSLLADMMCVKLFSLS
jgi:hypothetical protein